MTPSYYKFDTEFDAIVVGTGPGGGSVARDLTKYGKKVLILERGDYEPTRGNVTQMLKRGWIPVTKMPITTRGALVPRGITTGGTSNLYTATAYEPPFEILEKYGVDIREEIAALRAELPIGPIRDDLMNPAARLFMQSARDLGHDCKKLDKFIYQDNCLRNCESCVFGCPNDAKWNSRYLVDEAVENGATIFNHAHVKRVITGFDGVGENVCMDPLIVVCGQIEGLEGTGKAVPMMTGIHLKEEGVMICDLHLPKILKSLFDLQAFHFTKAGEV